MKTKTTVSIIGLNAKITIEYLGNKSLQRFEERQQNVALVSAVCNGLLEHSITYAGKIHFTDIKVR